MKNVSLVLLPVLCIAAGTTSTTAQEAPAVAPTAPTAPEVSRRVTVTTVPQQTRLAVLNLRASAGLKTTAQALTKALVAQLGANQAYSVLEPQQLQQMLVEQNNTAIADCAEMACFGYFGQITGAKYLVTGALEKVGEGHLLTLKLIDPAAAIEVHKETAFWRGDSAALVKLAQPYAVRLLAGKRGTRQLGKLEVVATAGARIVIDGKEAGIAPQPAQALMIGVHTLEVQNPGFLPLSRDVVVVSGQTTVVAAELVAEKAQPKPVTAVAAVSAAPVTSVAAAKSPIKAQKTVAILDLRGSEKTANAARALTVVVTAEVAATDGYRAVSRNDLKSLLAHQTDAQLLGCTEVKCMADIAKLAAADLLVAGSLERVDEAYIFSLELIDPAQPRVVERQTASWRDDPDRMVELARPYVDRLLAGTKAQAYSGQLEVVAPQGAMVVVDGKEVGSTPLNKKPPLATGVHTLQVTQDGFVPFNHDFVVIRGETTLVRAELIDEDSLTPWYARWWVWGSIGGGLVVIGGTVAAVAVATTLTQTPTTLTVAE